MVFSTDQPGKAKSSCCLLMHFYIITNYAIAHNLHAWTHLFSSSRGFSVSTAGRLHVFKPVSVQAMWYVGLVFICCFMLERDFKVKYRNYYISSYSVFITCFFTLELIIFDLLYIAGLPSRCCTKHVRCPVDTTISLEGWPLHGLAIMRAASLQSKAVSMSGMPWQI